MADLKITELPEDSSPTITDIIATVEDPGGTPVTKKVTLTNIDTLLSATVKTLTNKTLTTPIISNITAASATDMELNSGSSGADIVLGQGANGDVTVQAKGTGNILISPSTNCKLGIGLTPTANLHIRAGTATASTGPLKLTQSGAVLLTTPEVGVIEVDADVFYGTTDAGNRGYIPVRHFIRADSARTFTSNTSPQSIFNSPTNGRITLETGLYKFELLLALTGMSSTTGNAQLLFAGDATIGAWLWMLSGIQGTATTIGVLADFDVAFIATNASAASMVTASTGTVTRAFAHGTFEVTGAGTLIPQIDMVTASAAVASLGSYFMVERLGSTSVVSVGQWD